MVLDRRSRSSLVLQRKDWKRESCGLANAASSGRATLSFSVLGMAESLFATCLPPCFQLFPNDGEGKAHPALIWYLSESLRLVPRVMAGVSRCYSLLCRQPRLIQRF